MNKLTKFIIALVLALPVMAAAAIDLNSASKSELEALPGVGPVTADAIISARPIKSVDDLRQVKGMSARKFAKVAPLVSVNSTVARVQDTAKNVAEDARTAVNKMKGNEIININTASRQDLERLPEIGPHRADAIMSNRPFNRPEDVMKVKGIKEGTFNKIKDHITVR